MTENQQYCNTLFTTTVDHNQQSSWSWWTDLHSDRLTQTEEEETDDSDDDDSKDWTVIQWHQCGLVRTAVPDPLTNSKLEVLDASQGFFSCSSHQTNTEGKWHWQIWTSLVVQLQSFAHSTKQQSVVFRGLHFLRGTLLPSGTSSISFCRSNRKLLAQVAAGIKTQQQQQQLRNRHKWKSDIWKQKFKSRFLKATSSNWGETWDLTWSSQTLLESFGHRSQNGSLIFIWQLNINQTFRASPQHLQQSAVVGGVLLPLPVAVVHLVPAAGQKELTGAVQGGRVQRLAVDQADQVLPVVLPAEAQPHQGEYGEPGTTCGWRTTALTDTPGKTPRNLNEFKVHLNYFKWLFQTASLTSLLIRGFSAKYWGQFTLCFNWGLNLDGSGRVADFSYLSMCR